jgi:dipeptidyl aminopeptidase/acylaminoacyl peptidase
MICGRESSLQPRQIISVSTANGAEKLLYDPNPEFSAIRLGVTRRLYWKNKFGLASFGDLVLPPGFEGTERLPLIVTQYDSRGFLRGGTGDEYPIQLFAAHGYAVLSLQRPPFVTAAQSHADWRSNAELKKSLYQNHAERESLLSFVEEGVRLAVDTGLIDPQRIGITGLSDGTSTVNFALANTTLFAAAAISSAGGDSDLMIYGGPAVIEDRLRSGYPISTQTQTDFWKRASPAGNMDARPVPLLMQLSDHEALLGLQAYQSLLDRHWPAELYYYPDEYHIKTQPAHRKAIYERNLAWFDFWLKGEATRDSGWAATFARWKKLSVASGIMPGNPTARPALHVAQRQ